MTNEEKEIMADLFYYLRDHDNPPTIHDPGCEEFWRKAGEDLIALISGKWHEHPLAKKLGLALIVYIEDKSKGGADSVLQKQ